LAAVVAAAFGSFVLGLVTTVAEASKPFKDWLMFINRVGPLSGKTTTAVAAWALSWFALALVWRRRDISVRAVVVASAVLIGLGVLGTFPTFFEQFTAE
jgi:fluoride ion exporter CrcB/FEX